MSEDDALTRMTKIVNAIMAKPESAPFLEPVDWRGLELWDYPTVVKKMMDLGTIKRKLERGQYANAAACAADIRLVWSNCQLYNAPGSDFYILAKNFSRRFEDRYRKVKAEFDVGEEEVEKDSEEEVEGETDDDGAEEVDEEEEDEEPEAEFEDAPTPTESNKSKASAGSANRIMDPKEKLVSDVMFLNGLELGHLVSMVEKAAPEALATSDIRERLELISEDLDTGLFGEIAKYAGDIAAQRRKPAKISIIDISNKRKRKR